MRTINKGVSSNVRPRSFKSADVGSSPTAPTINLLVAKQCQHCKQAMYVHRQDDKITFAGCEPCITDIKLERVSDKEINIKGKRSTRAVRCQNCKRKHLLSSFEEVKDGSR